MKTFPVKMWVCVCIWVCATALSAGGAAADELKDDLAKLQGKWKATVTGDGGTSTWVLEFKDQRTKVTITNSDGEVSFKGQSDFKLEKMGKLRTYTYFNIEVQSGDNAGQKLLTGGETRSSAYRLDGDTWYTASGFEEGNNDAPRLIKWERQR